MMHRDLKIVFMGTPAFAVPSLDLLNKDFKVVAVVTAPDKPAGRGMKMHQSDVKKYATDHNIPVLQPTKLKSPEFLEQLKKINPDIQVVVAFRMLPETVWSLPRLGTINLHASLLPQYRGAAPIHWAVINGEKETGVTTFKLKHEIDTGNILMQEKVTIGDDETTGELHDKLMTIGAGLLLKTVHGIYEGTIKDSPQSTLTGTLKLKPAPKIHTEDCKVNWDQPTRQVFNFIRGLNPFPGAYTFLNDARIKIGSVSKQIEDPKSTPGQLKTDGKSFLKFATADGFISVLTLKPEGKREMSIEDFLRGRRIL